MSALPNEPPCPFCRGQVHTATTATNVRVLAVDIRCGRCGYRTRYDLGYGGQQLLGEVPRWMRGFVRWESVAPWARNRVRSGVRLLRPWWPQSVEELHVGRAVVDIWPVVRGGEIRWRRRSCLRNRLWRMTPGINRRPTVEYPTFEAAASASTATHLGLAGLRRGPPEVRSFR